MSKAAKQYSNRRMPSWLMVVAACIAVVNIIRLWPTDSRRVESLLYSLADRASCKGSEPARDIAAQNAQLLFRNPTTLRVEGLADDTYSLEQLVSEWLMVCSFERLALKFSQIDVTLWDHGAKAQARADLSVEIQNGGRTDHERRLASFTLVKLPSGYRISAVQISANIVNQPEPRP